MFCLSNRFLICKFVAKFRWQLIFADFEPVQKLPEST